MFRKKKKSFLDKPKKKEELPIVEELPSVQVEVEEECPCCKAKCQCCYHLSGTTGHTCTCECHRHL